MTSDVLPRLLVVDDNINTIRLMLSILDGLGEIFSATNGRDALSIVKNQKLDLILLDVEMPIIDGFALCAEIKHDPLHANLPIIFVTSHPQTQSEVYEKEYIHKDGTVFPVELRTFLLRKDKNNQPEVMWSIVRDITKRKQTETTLLLQARRASALLGLPLIAEQFDEIGFMQHGLKLAEELTGSQISFIHFVKDN